MEATKFGTVPSVVVVVLGICYVRDERRLMLAARSSKSLDASGGGVFHNLIGPGNA